VNNLEKYAKQLGYNTCYTNNYKFSHVNLTRKCVFIKPNYSLQRDHQFAHEIGHIIIFRYFYKGKMIDEALAWIVGLYVCIRCRVELKGFFKEMVRCLKTYMK
jgi:hypothetical protein